MTKRSGGQFHGKTRNLVRHHMPSSLKIADKIKSFEVGDKVAIIPKSTYRDAPHPRFKGRIGEVIEKRGSAYVVKVRIMNATRKLIVPVIHLEKV